MAYIARCLLCTSGIDADSMMEHLQVWHPDVVGAGEVTRWPDGSVVCLDQTLTPMRLG